MHIYIYIYVHKSICIYNTYMDTFNQLGKGATFTRQAARRASDVKTCRQTVERTSTWGGTYGVIDDKLLKAHSPQDLALLCRLPRALPARMLHNCEFPW